MTRNTVQTQIVMRAENNAGRQITVYLPSGWQNIDKATKDFRAKYMDYYITIYAQNII